MTFQKFKPDFYLRRYAEWLLTPSPFSEEPKPTEEEIEKVYQFLRHVDWGSIEWEEEE